MRTFLLFVVLLAGSLLIAAALTYPAWLLVSLISIEPVHRVMHRVAMLVALIGLISLTRRLHLSNRESLGFGLPRRQFLRQLAAGWIGGLLLMLPLVALLLWLGIREVRPDKLASLGKLIAGGIVSGLIIALLEEVFFRGVLFTAVRRTSGAIAAVVAPSTLYAALHFLGGKLSVPAADVSWQHGFIVLARLFERYVQPLALADSFFALLALGILLSLFRLRTGAIAAGMGLHAAGVAVIAVLRGSTRVNEFDAQAFLVGNYDGVIGWAALAWFALIIGIFVWRERPLQRPVANPLNPRLHPE